MQAYPPIGGSAAVTAGMRRRTSVIVRIPMTLVAPRFCSIFSDIA